MIPIARPLLGNEEIAAVTGAITSGWISSKGPCIPDFEQQFARYCRRRQGIATSNGTTALHLALAALGIGAGDEVIIPSFTFIATANVIAYCQATPVVVDAHPDYWCMNPEKIEKQITSNTKAIIPVHLYGHPCDMDPILEIAEKHGLSVVEDCAEAHGARYKNKPVGSFGTISCFSFFGNKIITTGEGGMCLTNDTDLADHMRTLRDHGKEKGAEYRHNRLGFNYRMTNIQAAIGIAQLKKINAMLAARQVIAGRYTDLLNDAVTLPPHMPWAEPVCWLYTILTEQKEAVAAALHHAEIETRPVFLPIHQQPIHRSTASLPVAESLHQKGLSLPTFVGLENQEIEQICEIIRGTLRT